jgi:hypothetical protein
LPQTDATAVVDVVLDVDVLCTGALDEVELVDVVLGVAEVVDVVAAMLVEVVLGPGAELVLVVLVVLVDVLPPTVDEVVDDVLVVDGTGVLVDVVVLPGAPSRTVT